MQGSGVATPGSLTDPAVPGGKVGSKVKVGNGVWVGGSGVAVAVAVGIAAWVCVIAIQASAMAVLAISAAVSVGSGAGPQADIMASMKIQKLVMSFFVIDYSQIFLSKMAAVLLNVRSSKQHSGRFHIFLSTYYQG